MSEGMILKTIRTRRCDSCAEAIHADAIVCKHCTRSQGWRRHLDLAVSTLPLLIATLSAAAFAFAFARPWLYPPSSELVASFQLFANERIAFAVTNVGERPGSVEHFQLTFQQKPSGTTSFDLPVVEADQTFVAPGVSVRATAMAPERLKPLLKAAYEVRKSDVCTLNLQMVRSNGKRQHAPVAAQCWKAMIALLPEIRQEILDGLPQHSQ